MSIKTMSERISVSAGCLLIGAAALFSPLKFNGGEISQVREQTTHSQAAKEQPIRKVLFIGDSMTGWMAERLNSYGEANGFEVATIVWDGSTIKKWGAQTNLKQIIDKQNPDAVFISLGLNELFIPNPESALSSSTDKILSAIGNRPMLWIGPPSWIGQQNKGHKLDSWLAGKLGPGKYFSSLEMDLPRQGKNNQHPTRDGIIKWMDEVVKWIPENSNLNFKSLDNPGAKAMSRGKIFIYKRMKETL